MPRSLAGPVGPQICEKEFRRLSIPKGAARANTLNQRRKKDLDQVRYYYRDMEFDCRKCGVTEVWTIEQQRFWYEDCKGDPNAVAIHCRKCRRASQGDT